jgi:hypothetical protein
VNALRRIHRTLTPGGILLDIHPVPPEAAVEAQGTLLGRLDETDFLSTVRATEDRLEETVLEGLFEHEAELEFDWIERYDTGAEALETVSEWEGYRVPEALAERMRQATGPVDVRERITVRRLRAG